MTFAACSGAGQEGDHEPPTEAARPVRIYAVRGHVVSLPADNGGEIRVAHEAIHDFVSAAGEVVGMDSMTMSFPLAKDVDISALTVGDAVELQLRIDWSEDDPAVVTQLARLPDGTQLVFGEATPPASVRE